MVASTLDVPGALPRKTLMQRFAEYCRRHPTVVIGASVLVLMTIMAIAAPLIAGDPMRRFGTPTGRHDATLAWLTEGRNRKSVTVDLRQAEGVQVFL